MLSFFELLKEFFKDFIASKFKHEVAIKLKEFRMQAYIADIPEFNDCLTILKNWELYILNAFTYPHFNRFTEGIYKLILLSKFHIIIGHFNNLGLRILHTQQMNKKPITY